MEDESAEIFKGKRPRCSSRLSVDLRQVEGLKSVMQRGDDDSEVARPRRRESSLFVPNAEELSLDVNKVLKMYGTYSSEHLSAFGQIMALAREDDITVDPPEIVLIGLKGSGKTSVLEAILGHPVLSGPSGYTETRRPLCVQVLHNAECHFPRVTLRRDPALPDLGESVVVSTQDLPAELSKRNVDTTDAAIVLIYETADLMNMTLIDTPGLRDDSDESKARVDELVQRIATQTGEQRTRIALCVEQAGEWPSWLSSWVRKNKVANVSFGVFTEAHSHLSSFSSSAPLNKYFAERPTSHAQSFFVTLPTAEVCGKCTDPQRYKERVWQCEHVTIKLLQGLSIDKRFEANLGVERMRAALLDVVLRSYRQVVPLVRQQHKALLTSCDRDLAACAERLSSLTPWRLRGVAMSQVTQFLHTAQTLLDGTIENLPIGYAAILGQTLEQERQPQNGGHWYGANGLLPITALDDSAVPAADRPLFGRQQVERLLAEFRAVSALVRMDVPSTDEVLTALGDRRSLSNPADLAAVVSRLAKLRVDQHVVPLILQFHKRLSYNVYRIAETASLVLRLPKKAGGRGRFSTGAGLQGGVSGGLQDPSMQGGEQSSTENRLFDHWLVEKYQQYIAKMSNAFLDRCREELISERLIAWELRLYGTADVESIAVTDVDRVRFLTAKVFEEAKMRISHNVLLKCYNLFLDQTQIWGEIQAQINMALTEQLLEELFEIAATTERVTSAQAQLMREREAFVKQDSVLAQAAPTLGAKI